MDWMWMAFQARIGWWLAGVVGVSLVLAAILGPIWWAAYWKR